MYLCNEKFYSHSQFWGIKQAKRKRYGRLRGLSNGMTDIIRLIIFPLIVMMLSCVHRNQCGRHLIPKATTQGFDGPVCWQNENYRCMATYVVLRICG